MLPIYLLSLLAASILLLAGLRGLVVLRSFQPGRLAVLALIVAGLLTLLQSGYRVGWVSYLVPSGAMSLLYAALAGVMAGMTVRLYRLKRRSGSLLYTPRTFWSDHALDLAALLLILFGLYRTTLFQDLPLTPIRLWSGFSLLSLGLYSWTLRPVPEVRTTGILFLDERIPTRDLLSARWENEHTLGIDYRRQSHGSKSDAGSARRPGRQIKPSHETDYGQAGEADSHETSPIKTLLLHLPDPSEKRDADVAITRLLREAEEMRQEQRKRGISP